MIHLVGIVFKGGLGVKLFTDGIVKNDDIIWALISAMSTFSQSAIEAETKSGSFSEIKMGKYRILVYNPFKDDEESGKYVFMALQDAYDNCFLTSGKLREIHALLIPFNLKAKDPAMVFQTTFTNSKEYESVFEKIEQITRRTQIFPGQAFDLVNEIIGKFISQQEFYRPLVVMLRDIDGGLITLQIDTNFYEDLSFTDLILSNIIAENPRNSKTVLIERKAPDWVESSWNSEAFIMEHIGRESDFRLLARIVFPIRMRSKVLSDLKAVRDEIWHVIEKANMIKSKE